MSGNIPLYNTPSTPGGTGNSGLRFNKFCNTWSHGWSLKSEGNTNPKKEWIDKFAGNVGVGSELTEFIARRKLMLNITKGDVCYLETTSPFVTGLGSIHPVENGFTWHQTLGVPYFAGSSIKGVVREWAENWLTDEEQKLWNNKQDKKKVITRIFGSDDKEEAKKRCTGSVIFLDAIPTKPVKLKTEIMTPHYSDYYQDSTGKVPPGDWLSPLPIPFLAVDVGQSFQFSLIPRNTEGAENDLSIVTRWLIDSFDCLGAGAKTATGFGIFGESSLGERIGVSVNNLFAKEITEREKKNNQTRETLIRATLSDNLLKANEVTVQLRDFENNKMINKQSAIDNVAAAINRLLENIKDNFSHWSEKDRKKAVEICENAYDEIGWSKGKNLNKKQKQKQKNKKRNLLDEIWKEKNKTME